MTMADVRVILIGGFLFLALSLVADPKLVCGAIIGGVLMFAIYRYPIVGLGLMILSGTAMQVLGSEHMTGLPLSLGKVFGLMTFAAWGLRSVATRQPLAYSPQIIWLLIFVVMMVLSTQFSPDSGLAMDGLFRYAQLLLLYFMIVSVAGNSTRALEQACLLFSLSMVISVFIGLAEFYLPSLALEDDDPAFVQGTIGAVLDRDSLEGTEIKRITGGLSDSNWFAYTLAAALPLNLYFFNRTKSPFLRLLFITFAVLQVLGIVLSLTRSALIAVAVSVFVLVIKRRLPFAPMAAATVVGAAATLAWSPAGLERLFSYQYLQEGSTPLRRYLIEGGLALLAQRPVFGYGYSEFGPAFMKWLGTVSAPESVDVWADWVSKRVAEGQDQFEFIMPHNTVLQIGVEYGGFALFAAALFVVCIFRDLKIAAVYGDERVSALADCLSAATWGFLTCAMFGHLAMLKVIWILAGLAAATRRATLQSATTNSDDVGRQAVSPGVLRPA